MNDRIRKKKDPVGFKQRYEKRKFVRFLKGFGRRHPEYYWSNGMIELYADVFSKLKVIDDKPNDFDSSDALRYAVGLKLEGEMSGHLIYEKGDA